MASFESEALAQSYRYRYDTKIDCHAAPVTGFAFAACWVSYEVQFGLNVYRSWRLTYSDDVSQVVVGYFKPLNRGYFTIEHPDRIVQVFKSNAAVAKDVAGMHAIGAVESIGNDKFFSFSRPNRPDQKCGGFVRYGPMVTWGSSFLVNGFFCRRSREDIMAKEMKFFTDVLQFK